MLTLDEILLIFLMPIGLFYVIQLVLLYEFRDLATQLVTGRKVFTLLCNYDRCLNENGLYCLSEAGRVTYHQKNLFMLPLDCHVSEESLEDYEPLNPFRRVREDFMVLILSIFITVLVLQLKGIIIVPADKTDAFLGLYFVSMLSIGAMGFLYKPERDDLSTLFASVHALMAVVFYWYIQAFELSWSKLPFLTSNGVLSFFTSNFATELGWFVLLVMWASVGIIYLPWRFLVRAY